MENRVMKALEFKAKCLELMDELNEHGGSITITKNGKPWRCYSPFNLARVLSGVCMPVRWRS